MTFEEILDQAMAMLQRRGRLTYGTLRRQFQLDDAALEDLKNELIEGQRVALDERGNVLVWMGAEIAPPHPTTFPTSGQDRAPHAYTPPHLTEKILTSRSALAGERKHVTVLFADLKGSMELLADRDPEEARQLLDPVLEHMMAAVHRYEGTVIAYLRRGNDDTANRNSGHAEKGYYGTVCKQAIELYLSCLLRGHPLRAWHCHNRSQSRSTPQDKGRPCLWRRVCRCLYRPVAWFPPYAGHRVRVRRGFRTLSPARDATPHHGSCSARSAPSYRRERSVVLSGRDLCQLHLD